MCPYSNPHIKHMRVTLGTDSSIAFIYCPIQSMIAGIAYPILAVLNPEAQTPSNVSPCTVKPL